MFSPPVISNEKSIFPNKVGRINNSDKRSDSLEDHQQTTNKNKRNHQVQSSASLNLKLNVHRKRQVTKQNKALEKRIRDEYERRNRAKMILQEVLVSKFTTRGNGFSKFNANKLIAKGYN
mmetsp:Transcript_7457/g.6603  ORF Transcript_7457/g.6603 Transcript_7457/m.6603 type:complete len:120 (+) Transcript_7457:557-916(+)